MSEPRESFSFVPENLYDQLMDLSALLRGHQPLVYYIGGAVFSILFAYIIFRLLFRKKSKTTKTKSKKRSKEKKVEHQIPITSNSTNEGGFKNNQNRSSTKKLVHSDSTKTSSHESSSVQPKTIKDSRSSETPTEHTNGSSENQWITVSGGKKEKKPDLTATKNNSKKTKNTNSTQSQRSDIKSSKSKASSTPTTDAPPERINEVASTFANDEDTEEEWREVRFSRKGGKYKRAE